MPDNRSEIARRRAMARLNDRIRVVRRTYSHGELDRVRVLVNDVYYDVRPRGLALLETGRTPADLDLDPSTDQDD